MKVGSQKESNNSAQANAGRGQLLKRRCAVYIIAAVIAVIIVLLLSIGALVKLKLGKHPETVEEIAYPCQEISASSITVRASELVRYQTTQDVQEGRFSKLVDEIKGLKGYENDPNCVYPLIWFYILDSRDEDAERAFEQFKFAYGNGENFAKELYYFDSLDSLESKLKQRADFKKQFESSLSPGGYFMPSQQEDGGNQ